MTYIKKIEVLGFNWKRGALRLWVIVSVLWCLTIFSVRLLENEKAKEIQTSIPAPACKNGADICAPWERDWSKVGGAKRGDIVSEQGTIMRPNGVSAWDAIISASPWAIAPPLVALALGVALCWAFAGFRRDAP